MKKTFQSIMTLGIAATLIVSCAKENAVEKIVPAGFKTVEYTVASEAAKTSLSGDGADKTVNWVEGDEITIFYEGGSTTATASSSGPSTTFSAIVPEQAVCHAVYPSYAAVYADDAFAVTIPAEQDGAFANGNMSVAHLEESGVSTFYNVTSFVKVIVNDADYTKVVLKAVGGEDIAGTLAVTLDGGPEIGEVTEGESEITLNVAEPGTYYVAIVPGVTFTKGILVTYYKGDAEAGSYFLDANITIGRAMIASVGAAEERIGDYYVSETGAGSKSGKNEKNAMDPAALKALLDAVDDDKKPAQAAALNGSTIHFAAGTYDFGELVTMSYGQEVDVVFQGADDVASIITGNDEHRLLVVGDGVKATFDNIEFSHSLTAKSSEPAIILENGSESTFTNCKVLDNVNKDAGGANHSQAGILAGGVSHFENCEFARNEASYGASLSFKADATVNGCNFHNNTGVGAPGNSLYISEDCTVNVENCQFYDNTTSGDYGGAVSSCAGTLNMTGCSINNNQNTSKRGAAMRLWNGAKAVLTNCEMKNNHVSSWGGAVYMQNTSSLEIVGGTYDNNDGQGAGFVSVADKANLKITGAALTNNKATSGNGGAIVFESTGKLECTDVTFTGNTASSMAAVCYIGSGTADFKGCTFGKEGEGNTATSSGGVFRIKTSTVTIDDCSFTSNQGSYGGAISIEGSTSPVITVKDCHFLKCKTTTSGSNKGGAIMQDAGTLTVTGSTFDDCSSKDGGVYSAAGGSASFTDCDFGKTTRNGASAGGGCFFFNNSVAPTFENCWISAYSWTAAGVRTEGSSHPSFKDCTFNNCTCNKGGAVYVVSTSHPTFTGCTFSNCKSDAEGGVIMSEATKNIVDFTNCTFIDNRAGDGKKGSVAYLQSTASTPSTFTGCTVGTAGHGNYISEDGTLYLKGSSGFTVTGCTFTDNSAGWGAGIFVGSATTGGVVEVSGCSFVNNSSSNAKGKGAAIYLQAGGKLHCNNSVFDGNSVKGTTDAYGGAIAYGGNDCLVYLNACSFKNNSWAQNYGSLFPILNKTNITVAMNNCSGANNYSCGSPTNGQQCTWFNVELAATGKLIVANSSFIGDLGTKNGSLKGGSGEGPGIFRLNATSGNLNIYMVNNILAKISGDTNYGVAAKGSGDYTPALSAYNKAVFKFWKAGTGDYYNTQWPTGTNTYFGDIAWSDQLNCWTWNGSGSAYTDLASTSDVNAYISNADAGFYAWLQQIGAISQDGTTAKDARGVTRAATSWPGSYQNAN
ncbi:MAG: right-handed parallel beta-helix repeat-containing protein [Bacteroidales bacterium]|nr:right-handed parallel beta-helix repeat-containing protein [Bacteroidales bacterium]